MAEPQTPIIVSDTTATPTLGALIRYLLTAIGSFAIGRGWVTDETMQAATALAMIVGPAAYGIYLSWKNKRKLITAADAAPSSVAQVR